MKASSPARATVYLEPRVYRALKVRSALTDRTISELVNQAVLLSLREEAIDAEAVRSRARERRHPFEAVVKDLRRDGLL